MSKRKMVKKLVYEGLGFPIILSNAPMVEIRGVWALEIDYNAFQKAILFSLAVYPAQLTGNHIRFIRSWLGLTLKDFGERFGVSHAGVIKWESSDNRSAKISLNTEREIRLCVLDKIVSKADQFQEAYRFIQELKLKEKEIPLEIDSRLDLIAI